MIRLKIEVWNDFYSLLVYLPCMLRDISQSLLFFCLAPEKWGVRYPPLQKSGGLAYPPYPPKVTPMCIVIVNGRDGSFRKHKPIVLFTVADPYRWRSQRGLGCLSHPKEH